MFRRIRYKNDQKSAQDRYVDNTFIAWKHGQDVFVYNISVHKKKIKTLIDQDKTNYTTRELLSSKIQLLKRNLLRNGYPENHITQTIGSPEFEKNTFLFYYH